MKHKKLLVFAICAGTCAMALPMAVVGKRMFEKANETVAIDDFVDPISYETPKPVSLTKPNFEATEGEEPAISVNKVTLHYHNDDNKCQQRRFYTWVTGVDGIERMPDEIGPTDMSITLDFSVLTEYANMPSIYFIIKEAGTWSGQSEDTELVYEKYASAIVDGHLTVWTIPGEGSSIEIYETEAETKLPKITTAKFTDFKTIKCTCTDDDTGKWVPTSYKLYAFDKSYHAATESVQKAQKEFYLFKEGKPTSNVFEIKFNYSAKLNVQYMIESVFPGYENKPPRKIIVSCENLYTNARFEQYYSYGGDDLGVTYTPSQTTFKVWSPISALAQVNIYDRGDPKSLNLGGNDNHKVYNMYYTKGGVWEVTIVGDLKGKYYTYTLTHSAGIVETMDPYAKACGINGMRGFIYDKNASEANPNGWDTVPTRWDGVSGYDILTPQELSIYEVHIRDLTMDKTWVSNKNNMRGTYAAFAEPGTKYSQDGKTVTTGYDHIKELGVKAIQLLPVFDNDNDERPEKMKFNWGYNPLNYNCVDGGYSSDPMNPLTRIVEYKNLIKAYSENGNHTRVIMDVVYNHVSSASSSCFTKCMPKYYFRYNENWVYEDGSGCSNEVRSEATMMRKYIVDSLVWWASEYKVKGFRFDLMGLIDVDTMRQVKEALFSVDPDIVVYGEGWQSIAGYHGKGVAPSDTSHVYSDLFASQTSPGYVGAFNDKGRDNVKGGNDHGWGTNNPYPSWGFISQGAGDIGNKDQAIVHMMRGANADAGEMKGANPYQTINYVSCHDNYTVWDQLRYCLHTAFDAKATPTSAEPSTTDMIYATLGAHGAVLFSNGLAFIQGGEELYRTKNYSYCSTAEFAELTSGGINAKIRPFPDYKADGDPSIDPKKGEVGSTGEVRMKGKGQDIISHNSYRAPDSVNSFKWDRKIKVNGVDTTNYNAIWSNMVKARNDMHFASLDELSKPGDEGKYYYNAWTNDYNNRVVGAWARLKSNNNQGYAIIFGSREGGSFSWGGISRSNIVVENRSGFGISSSTVNVPAFGFAVYKING